MVSGARRVMSLPAPRRPARSTPTVLVMVLLSMSVSHHGALAEDVCQMRSNETSTENTTMACSKDCLVHCWHRPWSPCLHDCALCKAGGSLFVAAMLPFVGRLAVDSVITEMVKRLACRHPAVQIGSVVVVSGVLSAFWAVLSAGDVLSKCARFPGCRWRCFVALLCADDHERLAGVWSWVGRCWQRSWCRCCWRVVSAGGATRV
eukprot:COSAG01_NODE_9526_length_2419_cov_2.482759_2_plen_205_part_00